MKHRRLIAEDTLSNMLRAGFLRRSGLAKAHEAVGVRRLHITRICLAALAFGMPAMSPTMTEGGVVLWKFKPGESFNAGDVLLEVETDKSTIDVEVTDDGILWKIVVEDGATGVPVGTPIAYIAEPGDDLLTLLIPESKSPEAVSSTPTEATAPDSLSSNAASSGTETIATPVASSGEIFHPANPNQKFTPSVELLLHEHGISRDDAIAKISASGPNGRLLQGDVLAHVGAISKDSIERVVSYIKSRQHLDLSSITLATPEELRRLQQIESQAESEKEVAPTPQTPKTPTNIRTLSLVSVLPESIGESDFLHAVRQAVSAATRDAYSLKFPQYASSPLDSGLSNDTDSLFDQLVTPLVTQDRFEVVSITCKQEKTMNFVADADDLFDDLMSVPKPARSQREDGPVTMVVDATLRLNEKAGDSSEFYNVFKNALRARYPVEHVNVIG